MPNYSISYRTSGNYRIGRYHALNAADSEEAIRRFLQVCKQGRKPHREGDVFIREHEAGTDLKLKWSCKLGSWSLLRKEPENCIQKAKTAEQTASMKFE